MALGGTFFIKRALSQKAMIEGGKVHYNGQRAKTSKEVEVGATIKLRQGNDEKRNYRHSIKRPTPWCARSSATYQETEKSVKQREAIALARKANALSMPHPDVARTKKERRELVKFKDHIL